MKNAKPARSNGSFVRIQESRQLVQLRVQFFTWKFNKKVSDD